jgi:dihydropteroate synthase
MKGLLNYTINVNGRLMDLSEPRVMGILNVTPDSFYAGSRKQTETEIAARANQIVQEGGEIIDIGAFSTRPGAAQVSSEEEMQRMRRALEIVRKQQPDAVLSIDTFRPEVAQMAVEEYGAAIINDVSEGNLNGAFGGADATNPNGETEQNTDSYPAIFRMVARLGVPYILMSTHGVLRDIVMNFAKEVQQLRDLGAKDIILDPGFGFGKTLEQNYALLRNMKKLQVFNLPLLVGVSRKSMIYKLSGTTPAEALNGTTAINTLALLKGAGILRVHDVKECVETVNIVKAMLSLGEDFK